MNHLSHAPQPRNAYRSLCGRNLDMTCVTVFEDHIECKRCKKLFPKYAAQYREAKEEREKNAAEVERRCEEINRELGIPKETDEERNERFARKVAEHKAKMAEEKAARYAAAMEVGAQQ